MKKEQEFDAVRFAEDYGIDYWTEGKNVSPGWVAVTCPFCDDTSNHGAFNPVGGYFSCWKCGGHSLYSVVKEITGERVITPILEKYGWIQKRVVLEERTDGNEGFEVPGGPLKEPHKLYLEKRGFDPEFISKKYGVLGTMQHEKYAYRIITPVYWDGEPVSFLGRDFTNKQTLRHKDCAIEESKIYHKKLLYGLEFCKRNRVIVVEGAYDKWRMGGNTCATLGTGWTQEQLMLLQSNYKEVFILFDKGEIAQKKARELALALNSVGVYSEVLKTEFDEPDNIPESDIKYLKRELRLL